MSDNLQTLRVFIASPSDLKEERKAVKEIVDDLNISFVRETNWHIQLLGCNRGRAGRTYTFTGRRWRSRPPPEIKQA